MIPHPQYLILLYNNSRRSLSDQRPSQTVLGPGHRSLLADIRAINSIFDATTIAAGTRASLAVHSLVPRKLVRARKGLVAPRFGARVGPDACVCP